MVADPKGVIETAKLISDIERLMAGHTMKASRQALACLTAKYLFLSGTEALTAWDRFQFEVGTMLTKLNDEEEREEKGSPL